MKTIFILTIVFVALTTSCVRAQNRQSEGEEEKLKALVNRVAESQISLDAAALDELYSSDFIEVSGLGAVYLREKVISDYKSRSEVTRGKFTSKVSTDDYTVRLYNEFAVVIAKITATLTIENRTLNPVNLRMMAVCRKEKDKWKVVSTQLTKITPPEELLSEPPPPPPPAPKPE